MLSQGSQDAILGPQEVNRGGRPPNPPHLRRRTVCYKLTPAWQELVSQLAKATGESKSDLFRRLHLEEAKRVGVEKHDA